MPALPLHGHPKRPLLDGSPAAIDIVSDEPELDEPRPRRIAVRRSSIISSYSSESVSSDISIVPASAPLLAVPSSSPGLTPSTISFASFLADSSVHHSIFSSLPFTSFSSAATPPANTIPSPSLPSLSQALPTSPIISISVAPSLLTTTTLPGATTPSTSLNVASASFYPTVPPSIPSNKPGNNRKSKKSDVPTTPKSFQNEQTKVELDIVRTKLKQTETKLKDVNDMNNILTARNKLFEEQRVKDAHANLFNAPQTQTSPQATPSHSPPPPLPAPPPAPVTVSPQPPSQSPANNTIESLIQLELLKTIRSAPSTTSTPAATAPPPCSHTAPPTCPQSPPPCTGLCKSQLNEVVNLLQSSLSQVSLLTHQIQMMDSKISKISVTPVQKSTVATNTTDVGPRSASTDSQTQTPPVDAISQTHSSNKPQNSNDKPAETDEQELMLGNFDPRVPPPTVYNPKVPPPQVKPEKRRILLPTPHPLHRPPLQSLFDIHFHQDPRFTSRSKRTRHSNPIPPRPHVPPRTRVPPRPHVPLRPRVPPQQTQQSTPKTDTQPAEHTIDPKDLIEHILDAIFKNTQKSNDDDNSSARSLDDSELTDNLGNNLNWTVLTTLNLIQRHL